MNKNLTDVIDSMKDLYDNDSDIGDYAKVFIKDFIDDLVKINNNKTTMLTNMLGEFRRNKFCNRNFSDCLDCINHKECEAIRTVSDMVVLNKNQLT